MEHVLKEPLLNIYEIKERYNTKCMNIVMRLSVCNVTAMSDCQLASAHWAMSPVVE